MTLSISATQTNLWSVIPGERLPDGSILLTPQPPAERARFYAGLVELLLVRGLTLGLSPDPELDADGQPVLRDGKRVMQPGELSRALWEIGVGEEDVGGSEYKPITWRKLRAEVIEAIFYGMLPIVIYEGQGGMKAGASIARTDAAVGENLRLLGTKYKANRATLMPLLERAAGKRTDPIAPASCPHAEVERAVLRQLKAGVCTAAELAEGLGWPEGRSSARRISKLIEHMRSEHACPVINVQGNRYTLAATPEGRLDVPALRDGVKFLQAIGDGLKRRGSDLNAARMLWFPADPEERQRALKLAAGREQAWRERRVIQKTEDAAENARRQLNRELEVVTLARGIVAERDQQDDFTYLEPANPKRAKLSPEQEAMHHEYEIATALVRSADDGRVKHPFVRLSDGAVRPSWLPKSLVKPPKARGLNEMGTRAKVKRKPAAKKAGPSTAQKKAAAAKLDMDVPF